MDETITLEFDGGSRGNPGPAGIGAVLRDKNKLADKLANRAMDRRQDVTDSDDSPIDEPAPEETKAGDRFVCARCGCEIRVHTPSSIRPHQLKPFVCQCGNRMNPT